MKNWHGIMKIDEIIHRNLSGQIVYKEEDVYNILHLQGEQTILSAVFVGGSVNNTFIPNNYYLGLDNRATITENQTLANLVGEPSGNGYSRQPLSSSGGFTVINNGGIYQARSNVVVYAAVIGSWGPVVNIFLTNSSSGSSGQLYSTAVLTAPISLSAGETITARFSMALRNC